MSLRPLSSDYVEVSAIKSVSASDCFGRIGLTLDCGGPFVARAVRYSLSRGQVRTLQRLFGELAGSTKAHSAARTAPEDVNPDAALRALRPRLSKIGDIWVLPVPPALVVLEHLGLITISPWFVDLKKVVLHVRVALTSVGESRLSNADFEKLYDAELGE
jgi:hypothetical protein